jgi:glyoxylate reductase
VLTDATADLAFGLILATMRRIPEGERFLRDGRWRAFRPDLLLGHEVTGSTLGVVGFGRTSQAVTRRAAGFRMRVLYASPREVDFPGATRVPLEALLAESDVVSLHCPLDASTRDLIDARALARMRRTAVLINTSRGGVVDEAALAEALLAGVIAGAGLDVFAREPAVHARLLDAPNAVLVPHIGSASRRAREAMARLAVEGVLDVLAGREPAHRV